MKWDPATHSANATDEYVFHQLIPYIGNKRKLLDLIGRAVQASGAKPKENLFARSFRRNGRGRTLSAAACL
jgi:adenine-specific DNA-methyltransferase